MRKLLLVWMMLWPLSLLGQNYSGLKSYTASAIGADTGVYINGSGISWHKLTWTKTGTVTACSVRVDSSADGITWGAGDVITAQDCSTNGYTIPYAATVNYIRINFVTSFTGGGSVTAVWTGYINSPGAVGVGTVGTIPEYITSVTIGDSICSFVGTILTCTGGASFGGTGTSYFTGPVDLGGNALTNTVLNAEGTGNVLTTVQFISFEGICQNTTGSFSFDLPPTNPAVAACPTGTNIPVRGSLDFNDTTRNNAYGSIWLPPDWTATGGVDVDIEWFAAATTGHVVWRVATTCTAKDAAYDGALNAASTVTSTAEGTTNLRNVASITGIDVTGCAATNTGTRMFFNFYRLPTDAADDMAGDARLVALRFKTRRAQ